MDGFHNGELLFQLWSLMAHSFLHTCKSTTVNANAGCVQIAKLTNSSFKPDFKENQTYFTHQFIPPIACLVIKPHRNADGSITLSFRYTHLGYIISVGETNSR